MCVHVTRFSYTGSDEDTMRCLADEQFLPALKNSPGFQHYHGGVDREARRAVAISIWDTLEHSRAIRAQRAAFEDVGVVFEPPETFKVTSEA